MPGAFRIDRIRHPHHLRFHLDWTKWRLAFEGGRLFKDEYLVRFSKRETKDDFDKRKKITYVPAHAKSAVLDVRNSIYQRMIDITRMGGAKSYQEAIKGLDKGVDNKGSSMDVFIGKEVLTELCVMGKVGVYIDKPAIEERATLDQTRGIRPYLYYYQAEDIFSWRFDAQNNLTHVLLRDRNFRYDEETNLIDGIEEQFRLLSKTDQGVEVRFFDIAGKVHSPNIEVPGGSVKTLTEVESKRALLNLREIPFVIGDLSHSLMTDIADIQIALLNMSSADVAYSLRSNFPFYVEQYHPQEVMNHTRPAGAVGTAVEAKKAGKKEVNVGSQGARRYPKGVEAPRFINPDADPLRVSMEKQGQLREEISQILNLSVSNLKPIRASAESKQQDDSGLEAGLSAIGLTLETLERGIGRIWAQYEGAQTEPTIKYPSTYQVRSEADRRREAKEIQELIPGIPSKTFQKEAVKDMVHILAGHKLEEDTLKQISDEIDEAPVVVTDPDTIWGDHEAGLVSTETASKARGYADGEAEQAAKDHAERLARIAAAQSAESNENMAARGVPDADPNQDSGKEERDEANNTDTNETTADPTRGEGK